MQLKGVIIIFSQNSFESFFLGANTFEGFKSFFSENFDNTDGWKVYILKGGAGTGKSTLLKKIALKLKNNGERVTVCPCSADYNSLDAIIVQDKKLMVLDGTAPHVVEPKYPGVSENIVNLAAALNTNAFLGKEKQIISLCEKNSMFHSFAARYICAAGKLLTDRYLSALKFTDTKKCENYAAQLVKKTLKPKNGKRGKIFNRYLLSASANNLVSLCNTFDFYDKVIPIEDEYFTVSNTILRNVCSRAAELGYDIICCNNPFVLGVIDHLFIPEMSIAFCTKNRYYTIAPKYRTVHAERFMDLQGLKGHKNRLNFSLKTADMLISYATEYIGKAKAVHDEIEKYYINAMDYNKLNEISDELLCKL